MPCPINEMHVSLFILDDEKKDYIEHTCACWAPVKLRDGILRVDRSDPTAHEKRKW